MSFYLLWAHEWLNAYLHVKVICLIEAEKILIIVNWFINLINWPSLAMQLIGKFLIMKMGLNGVERRWWVQYWLNLMAYSGFYEIFKQKSGQKI